MAELKQWTPVIRLRDYLAERLQQRPLREDTPTASANAVLEALADYFETDPNVWSGLFNDLLGANDVAEVHRSGTSAPPSFTMRLGFTHSNQISAAMHVVQGSLVRYLRGIPRDTQCADCGGLLIWDLETQESRCGYDPTHAVNARRDEGSDGVRRRDDCG